MDWPGCTVRAIGGTWIQRCLQPPLLLVRSQCDFKKNVANPASKDRENNIYMGISQGEHSEGQWHFQHLLSSPDTKPTQSRRNLSILCLTRHCSALLGIVRLARDVGFPLWASPRPHCPLRCPFLSGGLRKGLHNAASDVHSRGRDSVHTVRVLPQGMC